MDLPVAIGEIVANKYRIDRVIGAGGMGVVVAAFHLELEQPVAIKFLNAEAGSRADAGERFRREARAAARIRSDHVARVLDIEFLNNQIPYMVMELLEGHDFERELQITGPLPVALATHYILQAIDAVAEAHASGVVHRDLKPTNLFLARRADGSSIVKVLDFGISKLVGPGWGPDAALTRSASIIGSPLYMSPEQMRSAKDVDARSDIWSLGAILYELISGRPPYVADSMPALCMAILNAPPRPLREVASTAPAELEAILLKCLAREASDRYASVADLAHELVAFAPLAQVHSDRARRVLGLSAARFSSTPAGINSLPPPTGNVSGNTPAAEAPSLLPLRSGPTQASWGKTGRRAIVNRRTGTILAALLLLGVCAVALMRFTAPADDPVERARPVVPAPVALAEAPAKPPEAAPQLASAVAEPPALASATPAPAGKASVAAAPAAKPAAAKPVAPAGATPPATRTPGPREKGQAGLTDFGGRLY